MEQADLDEATDHAEELLVEEANHTRQPSFRDPATKQSLITEADIRSLFKRHTFLEEFSDSFIRSTPIGNLMKIETTSMKIRELERAKDASDKLVANKAALASTFTTVPEGRDNRSSSLHPARFLGGAGCSAARIWLTARESVGLKGYPPISNYDKGAVGLAGYVSAKGWSELHNMSSSKLSVRMFNINSASTRGGSKKNTSKNEEEMLDLAEFKLALRAMRTAFHLAVPWNLSILALEGFFFQSNFCSTDLSKTDKKGWYLTRFTDYVLEQNSDRWRDAEPFLTAGELKTSWAAFFGSQPKSRSSQAKPKKTGEKEQKNTTRTAAWGLGICFMWNIGQCVKPAGSCKSKKGTDLKYICNHVVDPAKPLEVCGKEHMRKNFH